MMVVFAIATIALIALVFQLFVQPQESLVNILKKEITKAESDKGTIMTYQDAKVVKDNILTTSELTQEDILVSFECTDPNLCCAEDEKCEKVNWSKKYVSFNQDRKIDFYTRCMPIENLVGCTIYFGKKPSEAKIIEIKLDNTKKNVIVTFKNDGTSILREANVNIKIMKKVNDNWKDTEIEYTPQFVDLLENNGIKTLNYAIDLKTSGEYKASVTVSAKNGGIDNKELEFTIKENENCITIDGTEVISWPTGEYETDPYDETIKTEILVYREIHKCSGCNFGYECLAKWMEKKPNSDLQILTNNSVYCEDPSPSTVTNGC